MIGEEASSTAVIDASVPTNGGGLPGVGEGALRHYHARGVEIRETILGDKRLKMNMTSGPWMSVRAANYLFIYLLICLVENWCRVRFRPGLLSLAYKRPGFEV